MRREAGRWRSTPAWADRQPASLATLRYSITHECACEQVRDACGHADHAWGANTCRRNMPRMWPQLQSWLRSTETVTGYDGCVLLVLHGMLQRVLCMAAALSRHASCHA